MMRPLMLLMFLLLLSILIHDAQAGIRLRKGSLHAVEQHIHHEKISRIEEGIDCKSNKCSGSIRKPITMIHISSPTTINAKNYEELKDDQRIARKEEIDLSDNSSSKTQPETMDISEMDYSLQARRKPPIHN